MAQACSNCGKRLGDRSKFCPGCGAPRVSGGATAVVGAPVRMSEGHEAALDIGAVSAPRRRVSVESASGTAAATEPADFGQRLGAFLFDLLLFLIVLMVATFLLSSTSKKSIVGSNAMLAAFYVVALTLFALNFVLLAAHGGQTIGKRLVGIRVVREDGEPVGLVSVLVRHCAGYLLSALGAFLGFLWVVWDPKHQGWHDKIARTIVVLAR
jgi:uncharacterized RDD family membrane protein YckC